MITNCILDYGALCQVDSMPKDVEMLPKSVDEGQELGDESDEPHVVQTSSVSLNWILIASITILLTVLLFLVLFGDYSNLIERFRYVG